MSEWKHTDDPDRQLVDRLENSDGKVFLESVKHLREIAQSLDDQERDKIAATISQRLWRERHPLILRGGIAALGLLAAGVTARVSLEAIARSPEKFPPWLWVPATESLMHMGWGSNFTKHFLASILSQETDIARRVSLIESINALSSMARQLVKDERLVREAAEMAEPQVRDALIKLVEWAHR